MKNAKINRGCDIRAINIHSVESRYKSELTTAKLMSAIIKTVPSFVSTNLLFIIDSIQNSTETNPIKNIVPTDIITSRVSLVGRAILRNYKGLQIFMCWIRLSR